MVNKKEIVDKLKRYMDMQGLNQVQLAKKLGWTPADMSNTMTGKKPVGGRRLAHIAKTLGLTFEVGGSAPTYPPEVQRYVDKLVAVLTGPDKRLAGRVEGYLDALDVAPPLVRGRKKATASSVTTSKTGT